MNTRRLMLRLYVTVMAVLFLEGAIANTDCVILLHGLARTASSMSSIEEVLSSDGYRVVNLGYDSRSDKIENLAIDAVEESLAACHEQEHNRIHFVTHSLGGILIRYYLNIHEIEQLGRVVMLAPPNQGSEVADNWRDVPGYKLLNGPAGKQLGTGHDSLPLTLGPVDFELGVIAGSRSFNPILSISLPDPDDGKVSARSTRVDGMSDFVLMPHTHTFMMRVDDVIDQVRHFLTHGKFSHTETSAMSPDKQHDD